MHSPPLVCLRDEQQVPDVLGVKVHPQDIWDWYNASTITYTQKERKQKDRLWKPDDAIDKAEYLFFTDLFIGQRKTERYTSCL